MKILFISPANNIHTVRWVNALANRGHKVVLVSLPNHKEGVNSINNVKVIYLPIEGIKGYYLNAYILYRLEKKLRPDIINVHYASGYGTLARVARLKHIILSVWGSDVYDFPYKNRLNMFIIQKNLQYAEHIASTSCSMAKQVRKLIGERKITITPFGVDINIFYKQKRDKTDYFTLGIVKTLSEKYGVDTVIKAFYNFVNQTGEDVKSRLLIYGSGEQREELLQLCERLGISERVYFKGYIPNTDVPKALCEMDVVCFGSRRESFGVSAVEAMACETPIVATNVSGFREVLDDGEIGFLVEKDDYKEMANKILLLYQHSELREKMGTAGRKKVLEFYNWENNVEDMEILYRGVLNQ